MDWHLSVLISILMNFFALTLLKRFQKPHTVAYFTWITFWGALFVIISALLFLHQTIHIENSYLLLLGILYAVMNVLYNENVEEDLEHTVTAYEIAPFLSIALALVFLQEYKFLDLTTLLGMRVLCALALAFFSIYFLSKRKFLIDSMFLTVLISATYVVLLKIFASTISPFEILFYVYIGSLLVLTPYALGHKRKHIYLPITTEAFITGIIYALSSIFYILALTHTPAIVILPIYSIGITLLPLLEVIIFFRKSKAISRDQLLGVFLGVFAIAFLL